MKKFIAFYLIVLSILSIKAVNTIYQGSTLVDQGTKIRQLEREMSELGTRRDMILSRAAESNSIKNILASEAITNYTDNTSPIVITSSTTVASR